MGAAWGLWQLIHNVVDMLAAMIANTAMTTLKFLHIDDALLVVVKPAGMLSVPGLGAGLHDNLSTRVQALHADARVVHRLDQATSGLMLFARGAAVQRALSMAFEARQVHKHYVAVVTGEVDGESGLIDAPLIADWPHRPRQKVDFQQGKPALTHWRVLERALDRLHEGGVHTTRLELQPVSGRTHQLRVHLQSIGHAIVGDALYAPAAAQQPGSARLMLHATRIALTHPLRQEACVFTDAAPF